MPSSGGSGIALAGIKPAHFCVVAKLASSPALRGYASILRRKLVTSNAMGFGISIRPALAVSVRQAETIQDVYQAHSSIRALRNCIRLNSRAIYNVQEAMPYAFNLNKNGVSPISLLFFFSGPSTVIRAIASVIILPLKRVKAAWLRPHILSELIKRIPLWANGNPAPAVARPLPEIWVVAPVSHGCPSAVKRMIYLGWQWRISLRLFINHNTAICHAQGGYENS